jgi:hypothetical protein
MVALAKSSMLAETQRGLLLRPIVSHKRMVPIYQEKEEEGADQYMQYSKEF